MAFASYSCAPPILSRSSSSSLMTSLTNVSANLPLSTSLFPWLKSSKHTSRLPSPQTLSLPSIAHFDRRPSDPPPPLQWRDSDSSRAHGASNPFDSYESSPAAGPSKPSPPSAPMETAQLPPIPTPMTSSQWQWVGPHPSSQAIAEKTCEMVCYLWFSNTLGLQKSSPHRGRQIRRSRAAHLYSDSPSGLSDASTAALQFTPSPQFTLFMHKLLQTTQVSQSVIVLSLHYIYRLKEENHFTNGQPGSEFRVAVVALMMANKFVDDNTYTNKTWSDVSGIELEDINKMEREFLVGVSFRLYVNTETYKAWVNLLQGLVSAKERDERQWQYSQQRQSAHVHAPSPRYSNASISHQRARSSSPLPSLKASYPFTFVAPTFANPFLNSPQAPAPESSARSGAKRPAVIAFSPPSAVLRGPPSKRPISLDMSAVRPTNGPRSAGMSYTLSAFADLSLNHSDVPRRNAPPTKPKNPVQVPQTLAAPYNLQERNALTNPENLYFYTLASSPATAENDNRARKALLRTHPPPYNYSTASYILPPQPPQPMYVQSASTSPVNHHLRPQSHLQHFRPHRPYLTANSNEQHPVILPPIQVWEREDDEGNVLPHSGHSVAYPQQLTPSSKVPVAPFANAGPPGVQCGTQQNVYHYVYLPHQHVHSSS